MAAVPNFPLRIAPAPAIMVPAHLPKGERLAIEETGTTLRAHAERCVKTVKLLANADEWGLAIQVAVKRARLSPADIATELGVMRSTVSRWLDGTMAPHEKSVPELLEKLVAAIRKTAA